MEINHPNLVILIFEIRRCDALFVYFEAKYFCFPKEVCLYLITYVLFFFELICERELYFSDKTFPNGSQIKGGDGIKLVQWDNNLVVTDHSKAANALLGVLLQNYSVTVHVHNPGSISS